VNDATPAIGSHFAEHHDASVYVADSPQELESNSAGSMRDLERSTELLHVGQVEGRATRNRVHTLRTSARTVRHRVGRKTCFLRYRKGPQHRVIHRIRNRNEIRQIKGDYPPFRLLDVRRCGRWKLRTIIRLDYSIVVHQTTDSETLVDYRKAVWQESKSHVLPARVCRHQTDQGRPAKRSRGVPQLITTSRHQPIR